MEPIVSSHIMGTLTLCAVRTNSAAWITFFSDWFRDLKNYDQEIVIGRARGSGDGHLKSPAGKVLKILDSMTASQEIVCKILENIAKDTNFLVSRPHRDDVCLARLGTSVEGIALAAKAFATKK